MIAKNTLHVTKKELAELFGLPEDVEVLAVRANKGYEDGFEFLLASAEEVYVDELKITTKDFNSFNTRKISLGNLLVSRTDKVVKDIMNALTKKKYNN